MGACDQLPDPEQCQTGARAVQSQTGEPRRRNPQSVSVCAVKTCFATSIQSHLACHIAGRGTTNNCLDSACVLGSLTLLLRLRPGEKELDPANTFLFLC